jgi:hypothetical protein
MKRRTYFAVVLLVLGVISLWFARTRVDARYISRISGVEIPMIAWRSESYDLDWCTVAKYRLPKRTLLELLTKHSFVPLATISKGRPLELPSLASMFEDGGSAFAHDSGLVAMRGRTATNKWEFVADPALGFFWVVVMFPDPAGHFPSS